MWFEAWACLRDWKWPARWMAASFCAAFALSAAMVALRGANEKGIDTALFATGRLNFLLFWPAYVGSALAALFGRRLLILRRHGGDFGLAFAAALLVHLGLIAWLCAIGAAPALETFVFFGVAAGFIYLMALFSWPKLQGRLGERGWWLLRTVGLNYVAYAFAADFLRDPLGGSYVRVLLYAPFAFLAVLGPALRLTAFAWHIGSRWGGRRLPARMTSNACGGSTVQLQGEKAWRLPLRHR